jgi:membrane associated rhomboid family serine protease
MIPIRDDIPAHRPPVVTVGVIVLCSLVFLWQLSLGQQGQLRVLYSYGMIPAVLLGDARLPSELAVIPASATLVTSMFLHGGWMHLLGNMLYLWIFGNNVEDRLGHGGFLAFYLLAGLAAAAAQILPDPESRIPMVGASGAISGVLGAYVVLHPNARVLVLVPIGFMFLYYVRALWLLLIWLALQILSALGGPSTEGGVAWWAHIGGFAAGVLMILPFAAVDRYRLSRRRRGPWG